MLPKAKTVIDPRHLCWVFVILSPVLLVVWKLISLDTLQLHVPTLPSLDGNASFAIAYYRSSVPSTQEEVKFGAGPPIGINTSLSGESLHALHGLLVDLITIMTQPTYKCRKLIRQGGKSCKKISDGENVSESREEEVEPFGHFTELLLAEMVDEAAETRWKRKSSLTITKVCLDSFSSAVDNCYVYSFGVGLDFSFDAEMGKYGCHVFAFDDDVYHDDLGRNPFPKVHFIHLRIGSEGMVRLVSSFHPDMNISHEYLYRPLDNIMYLLHQYEANIDLLKIDIDGSEFEVLEKSLFKTTILKRTQQLAIEVHLSELLDPSLDTGPALLQTLTNYTRVFQGLEEQGLRLTHYEPNFFKPAAVKLEGHTFSIYSEQVWVNVHLKKTYEQHYKVPDEEDFDNLEMS